MSTWLRFGLPLGLPPRGWGGGGGIAYQTLGPGTYNACQTQYWATRETDVRAYHMPGSRTCTRHVASLFHSQEAVHVATFKECQKDKKRTEKKKGCPKNCLRDGDMRRQVQCVWQAQDEEGPVRPVFWCSCMF